VVAFGEQVDAVSWRGGGDQLERRRWIGEDRELALDFLRREAAAAQSLEVGGG
jgi:hypothetical protein